ncbi:MAG: TRAM domain-containing protein [Candidatus Micrarchaeia archaeon]|jgi:predicted RNA-binding protein with TRAM domain
MGSAQNFGRLDRKGYRKSYNVGAFNKAEAGILVREGEEYDVKIEKLSTKGAGVAHAKKAMILVSGAKVGETCHVRITKVLSKHAEAKLA